LTSRSEDSFDRGFALAYAVVFCLTNFYYYAGHWVFAFRYLEVAEMLGRANKSNKAHLRVRKITGKINVFAVGTMSVSYFLMILNWILYL
jgi:hypothetical protein